MSSESYRFSCEMLWDLLTFDDLDCVQFLALSRDINCACTHRVRCSCIYVELRVHTGRTVRKSMTSRLLKLKVKVLKLNWACTCRCREIDIQDGGDRKSWPPMTSSAQRRGSFLYRVQTTSTSSVCHGTESPTSLSGLSRNSSFTGFTDSLSPSLQLSQQ